MRKIFFFSILILLLSVVFVNKTQACVGAGGSCEINSHDDNTTCCSGACADPRDEAPGNYGSCPGGSGGSGDQTPPTDDVNGDPKPPLPCAPGSATSSNCTKVSTGLGPSIATSAGGSITSIFRILLSISGGIAVLLIVISGYRLMTSQGNPEKIQGAREQLTAAIVGLIFTILSLVILQTLTHDILHIPGFN